MKTAEEIEAQVRQAFGRKSAKFRPCAYFDDRLDCIRVISRDCSVLETRINGVVTILEDNYYPESGGERYVGFTIKGARHFCQQHGLDTAKAVDLSKLLDALLVAFPEPAVQLFVDLFARPLVKKEKIKTVNLSAATLQPA
jgi:hypothetical protein